MISLKIHTTSFHGQGDDAPHMIKEFRVGDITFQGTKHLAECPQI